QAASASASGDRRMDRRRDGGGFHRRRCARASAPAARVPWLPSARRPDAARLRAMGTRQLDGGVILGTAGHIDHGKTALVRALTGVDTDRLPEEKRRGIT